MTYTAWSPYGQKVSLSDRFASGLFIETWNPSNENGTARAGGVDASPLPDQNASAPTLSTEGPPSLTKLGAASAAPIFSNGDRLQLIADDEL